MTDPSSVSVALTSVKTALEIGKLLLSVDQSMEKAEHRLKIASLMTSLAEAQSGILDMRELLREKDDQIAELQKAMEASAHLVRQGDAYYTVGPSGQPEGTPICSRCWDVEHKQRHLVREPGPTAKTDNMCPACKTRYSLNSTRRLPPAAPAL